MQLYVAAMNAESIKTVICLLRIGVSFLAMGEVILTCLHMVFIYPLWLDISLGQKFYYDRMASFISTVRHLCFESIFRSDLKD